MANNLQEDMTGVVDESDPTTDSDIECPLCEGEGDVVEIATLQDGAYLRTDSHCLGCRSTFPTWW